MATDTRLPLLSQVPDVGKTFSNALFNLRQVDDLRRSPLKNRLLEAQTEAAETDADDAATMAQLKSFLIDADRIAAMPPAQARMAALQRKADILEANPNADTKHTDGLIRSLETDETGALRDPTAFQGIIDRSRKLGQELGILEPLEGPGGVEFGKVNPGDFTPESLDAFQSAGGGAANFGLLEPHAAPQIVDIGGVPHLVSRSGSGDFVAKPVPLSTLETETEGEGAIAGAKAEEATEAELRVQAGLGDAPSKADVEADVTTAKARASAQVKAEEEKRVHTITYGAFKTGMDDYADALEGTMAGFFEGRLPAVTASQQIADGSKSVMLPLLKQLFRSAGEGVFTDKDQELLEGMLPTRKDEPAAQVSKLNMVNTVVAMKLGLPPPPPLRFGGEKRLEDLTVEDLNNLSLEELEALQNGNP
jgi:hypothetical protein